jgi:hypothetical protein
MKNQEMRYLRLALVLLSVAGLFVSRLYSSSEAQTGRRSGSANRQSVVSTLRSIDTLKQAFQREAGKVRLVTILSPT